MRPANEAIEHLAATPPATGVKARSARLRYLDDFRSLAILQIVLLHVTRTYLIRGMEARAPESNIVFAMNDALFHNATLYFTLISGILYLRLVTGRPMQGFYAGRATSVALPYLVMTVCLTLAVGQADEEGMADLLARIATNALFGEAFYTLWYVPVILILYLASPFLLATVRRPSYAPLVAILICLPLLFSRTGTEVTLSTILYFGGAYVLGLTIGLDLEGWLDRFERWQEALLATVLITTAGIVYLYVTGIQFVGPVDLRESAFYVQKLALGALFLVWLRRAEPRLPSKIAVVSGATAAMSFGIYFLHAPIIRQLLYAFGPFGTGPEPGGMTLLHILFLFAATMGLCIAIIQGIRAIFGRYSKWIIGA
nr:acyltransferase [Paracoccus saliphilus]